MEAMLRPHVERLMPFVRVSLGNRTRVGSILTRSTWRRYLTSHVNPSLDSLRYRPYPLFPLSLILPLSLVPSLKEDAIRLSSMSPEVQEPQRAKAA